MADVKQRMNTGDIPLTNPMNLTCTPVKTAADAASKYAVVIDKDGNATMPPGYKSTVFTSTEEYNIKSDDSSVDFNIPAGGLGIYSK